MSKSIELTEIQIRAFENNAKTFMFPISDEIELIINPIDKEYGDCLRYKYKSDGHISVRTYEEFFKEWCPIQKGDKDIFITEKKFKCTHCKKKQIVTELEEKISTQECPYCGYRNKVIADSFKECIDVIAVRVQDITTYEASRILPCKIGHKSLIKHEKSYNQQMQEQNINRTYQDNDYVFIAEFKR